MNGWPFFKRAWTRKKGSWFIQLLLFISYFFALSLSLIISYLCVKKYTWIEQPSLVISWVIVISVFLIVFLLQGFYQERMITSRKTEVLLIIKGVIVGSILLAILVSVSGGKLVFNRREGLLFFFICSLVLLALFRSMLFFHLRRHLLKKGIGVTNALIVGANPEVKELSKNLEQIDPFKYRIVGLIDKEDRIKEDSYNGFKIIGGLKDIGKLIEQYKIDEIYIVGDSLLPIEVLMLIEECRNLIEKIYVTTDMFELLNEKISLGKLRGIQLLKIG
jgi:FlaA1/EpsC-like NDP-sugar epimerase